MTSSKPSLFLFAAVLLSLSLTACDSTSVDDGDDDEPVLESRTVSDLPADPTETRQGTGRYTLFSLRDDEIVLSYSNTTNRADSSSTAWDIGFQSLNVITNGGASGPGEAAGYIAEQAFSEVTEVDTERLKADTESTMMLRDWYNYDRTTHIVTPLPGRTLVLRTADGEHYAKIRIESYYEGAPAEPASEDASRYYTFDYVLSDEPSFE